MASPVQVRSTPSCDAPARRILLGGACPVGIGLHRGAQIQDRDRYKKTVLVVDAEERIRKLVSLGLRRAGYGMVVASDGREALARIAGTKFDLIVSEITMPNLDSLGLLTSLREDPSTRAIPLILLTARGSTDDREEVVGQYIAAVLVPSDCPNDVPKLLEKLRRGERISHYKTKRITKDGKVLEVSLTLSPIKDSQDNIVGVSNVGRGVS
jgi:two-component system, chemotaxis family, chemotaxis protein CheY